MIRLNDTSKITVKYLGMFRKLMYLSGISLSTEEAKKKKIDRIEKTGLEPKKATEQR